MGRKIGNRICEMDGCSNKHFGKGYCYKHYIKNVKHGSKLGESRLQSIKERLLSRAVEDENGCWIFAGNKGKGGYGQMGIITEDGKSKSVRPHRLSYSLFIGEIPDGMIVLQRCKNKSCINPEHLFLGPAMVKFTEKDASQMRDLYREGVKQSDIAEKYKTSQGHVSEILSGKVWKP